MDPEIFKTVLPFVGGLFALFGGVFTFVNGRLKDAEDHDQRVRVLNKSAQWIALAPSILAIALLLVSAKAYVSFGLLFFSYVLQTRLFLRNPAPVQRIEILTFVLLTSALTATFLFLVFGSLLERIVENQAGMLEIQRNTIDDMKDSKSVP